MLCSDRFPTCSQPQNKAGKKKAFVINGYPSLPNLPNLFCGFPYARAPMCVNSKKNVGKVGKVGKHFDFAVGKASQPFLKAGKRLGSGVCRG